MPVDALVPRSRRTLIAASLGALGAVVIRAFSKPDPVLGLDPNDVARNVDNGTTAVTSVTQGTADMGAFQANGNGVGPGVVGVSFSGVGVIGSSAGGFGYPSAITPSTGVYGFSTDGTGVYGASGTGAGVYGANHGVGVAAIIGQGNDGTGVHGHAADTGGLGGSPIPSAPANTGVFGTGSGDAVGVAARSETTTAILAYSGSGSLPTVRPSTAILGHADQDSTSRGVVGTTAGGTGVQGHVGASTPPAPTAKTGVHGRCDVDASSYGVFGQSSVGAGTRGNTTSGTGLLGVATTAAGFGLRSIGRLSFQKASGVGTIANGASSVTVTPGTDVVSATFVILTAQADPGTRRLWATTDPVANTITIHVSSAVAANLKVAWLAIG